MVNSSSRYRQRAYWRQLLLYTVANALLAMSGRLLAGVDSSVAALWLPAGLDFAVLWHFGWQLWPGALLGPLLNSLVFADNPISAIGLALSTLLASMTAIGLARVLIGRDLPFASPRNAVLFATVVASLPYALGAGLGMLVLSLTEQAPANLWLAFRAWWLSDIAGLMMLAPLLLALLIPKKQMPRGPAARWERELLMAVSVLSCLVVFGERTIYEGDPAAGYLLFPPVMWAALRMGARETFFTVFAINLASILGLTLWYPQGGVERSLILLNLQVANIALAIISLLLVAATQALRGALLAQQQAQDMFRGAIEYAASGVALISPAGRILLINRALSDMLGYPSHELVGKQYVEIVHPDERPASLKTIARMTSGELPHFQARKRFIRRDGENLWVLITVTLLRAEDGTPLHFIGHVQNIDQFKRMEEALTESEARFRSLAESAPIGIYQLDLQGNALYANSRWSAMSGYRFEDSSGLRWLQTLHPDDRERAAEHFRAARQQHAGAAFEFRFVQPDGRIVWCVTRISPLFDRDGQLRGYVGSNEDITERKQTEQAIRGLNESLEAQVRQRTEQLAATNRELEAFTWSVSHDMRAPLRAIDGFASALADEDGDKLSESGKSYLARIRGGVSRLNELINAFLQLSRLSSDTLNRTELDLSALCEELLVELAASQPERQVACSVAPGMRINADPQQLRILLTNLLGNAWKFTSKTTAPQIRVFSSEQNKEVVYQVEDNGAGFDMAHADKLFTPFQRLHAQSEFEGSGIGLATCRRIVQRHHGRLWAESTLGKGSRFLFTVAG